MNYPSEQQSAPAKRDTMNKNKVLILALLMFSTALFCQTRQERKETKAREQEKQFAATKELLDSLAYEFSADWANSFQGVRINLVTNPNHLRMKSDQVKIYLPYYGVAHTSNAAFSNDGGIVYEGSVQDYRQTVNEKKKEITIRFRCRAKREIYEFTLTVYASGNSRLNVNSNIRTGMTYEGKTSTLSAKE